MKVRCPKCRENHNIQACDKRAEDKSRCANCGGDHKAAYKGCPYYKALREKQRQRKEEGTVQNHNQVTKQQHQFQLRNEEFPAITTQNHPRETQKQQPSKQWRSKLTKRHIRYAGSRRIATKSKHQPLINFYSGHAKKSNKCKK